jgi:archaeosortase A (PGF-CTERM-specific)
MAALFSWDATASVLAFAALGLLGAGFWMKGRERHALRIAGWVLFALYWPTQSAVFFQQDDPVNGWFTLLSPLFFGYLAFHEWQSLRWGEDPRALRWITGTAFVAAGTYFAIYKVPGMTDLLIGVVAQQSSWMLTHLFGVPSHVAVDSAAPVESRYHIFLDNFGADAYAVTIILACTAVQSIMIFVGAIACTEGAAKRRKWKAYAYTAPPIYLLNLLRNAGIVYGYKVLGLSAFGLDSFEFMHSYVGKGGSLLALVLIALAVFKTLPEMHENILDLFDLPKRRRPGFYQRAPLASATAVASVAPSPKGD